MSTRVAPLGWARVLVLLALVMVGFCALVSPAVAAEETGGEPAEQGPAPGIDEVGTKNEVSDQFRPDKAEAPPFMRFLVWPLAIVGILVALGLLFMYLTWQPRFAEERRSKRRR